LRVIYNMSVFRVDSSDKQIFINNTRLMGIQSCSYDTQKEFDDIRPIGQLDVTDRILKSNQTTNLALDFMLNDGGQSDPFFDFQTSGVLSIESFNFKVRDLVGETFLSGAYMTSYSIRGAVGELVKGNVGYQCDVFDFNSTGNLSYDDQSNDSFNAYQPQDISVLTNFNEGVSGLCIQGFDLSLSLDREPKNRMGLRTPQTRYPSIPSQGDLKFSIIKNKVTGVDLSSLVLEKGSVTIKLNTDQSNEKEIAINNCSLISVSESHNLDENATLDFSYTFSIENSGITFT